MSLQVILACVICFAITAVAGKLLIPELVKLKAGQSIKEIGPTWHMTKQGTPTMGGLMFIIGIGITVVIVGWKGMVQGDFTHIYVYLFALVFGVIGYIDDYQKVKHHRNTGLTAIQKFLLQLAAAKMPSWGKPFHTTPSTAKNAATGMVTLVDRPSNPSVMFTAFTVPTMIKAARIM